MRKQVTFAKPWGNYKPGQRLTINHEDIYIDHNDNVVLLVNYKHWYGNGEMVVIPSEYFKSTR